MMDIVSYTQQNLIINQNLELTKDIWVSYGLSILSVLEKIDLIDNESCRYQEQNWCL